MSDVTYPHAPARDSTVRDDTTYVSAMLKRTNWGAVIAGAVTAISLQLLFSVLGIALGATTGDVTSAVDGTNPDRISIAAGLWWLITGTISLYIGGCVVGRFSGMVRSPDVLLHAFVMWAVTAIFGFAVVSSGTGMALDKAVDSYMATTNPNYGRPGGFPMTADGHRAGDSDRVIRTADTSMQRDNQAATGNTTNNVGDTNLDKDDVDEARRVVRNASWWTLIALLVGIGVSLGGAWSTAPHRIVVRPTTAHD
jgi:hypothetical protein